MLPKMEKEKLFTIIYADILIFANANMLPKMEKAGCHLGNIGKNGAAPPPTLCINFLPVQTYFANNLKKYII